MKREDLRIPALWRGYPLRSRIQAKRAITRRETQALGMEQREVSIAVGTVEDSTFIIGFEEASVKKSTPPAIA